MESASARKPRRPTTPELDRLELMIRRLLESHDQWQSRAHAAEQRVQELLRAVEDVAAGRLDPLALEQQAQRLEAQNRALRAKLDTAHETVQRMLGRLQFVEEER